MQTYVIRRKNYWKTAEELEKSASLSAKVGTQEMASEVKWIRSYVVREEDGKLGTVCIYQGVSPEAIQEHARRAQMPADEIIPVENLVIVNDDPAMAAAGK